MSKPKTWSVYDDQDLFDNVNLAVTREHRDFDGWVPVIEKSAYTELEEKLRVAVEALKRIRDHQASLIQGDARLSTTFLMADSALKKYRGEK